MANREFGVAYGLRIHYQTSFFASMTQFLQETRTLANIKINTSTLVYHKVYKRAPMMHHPQPLSNRRHVTHDSNLCPARLRLRVVTETPMGNTTTTSSKRTSSCSLRTTLNSRLHIKSYHNSSIVRLILEHDIVFTTTTSKA